MFSLGEFLCGIVLTRILGVVFGVGTKAGVTESIIEKACQGTPWVIEESLIKKTLTCAVELKEKK